jgi:hypothetical protein
VALKPEAHWHADRQTDRQTESLIACKGVCLATGRMHSSWGMKVVFTV